MNRTPGAILSIIIAASTALACGDDEFGKTPTWKAVDPGSIRSQVFAWLESQSPDELIRHEVENLWPADDAATPEELLDRLAQTFALTSAEASALVERCSRPNTDVVPPEATWLIDEQTPAIVRNNLRLLYGRWLAQGRRFDTALLYLGGIDPNDVVDPAMLLFYRAVAHHRLVDTDASWQAVTRLLEREAEIPRRYQKIAMLMRDDLKSVEVDSLDHIGRRMDDIGRRLDLGQAGKKVREIEEGVIASLDKMIKKIEEEEQRRNQQKSAGGMPSENPMQDSRIGQQKGPGKVDKKDIGKKSGWGSMPPKQREEAMQQIGREFPSHYRDVIEQYFRRLATENTENER